jgi:hypothetical protein
MFATRRFVSIAPRAFGAARGFQSSARASVQVGNIAKELQGKGIIVGVPAAFSELPNQPWYTAACVLVPVS